MSAHDRPHCSARVSAGLPRRGGLWLALVLALVLLSTGKSWAQAPKERSLQAAHKNIFSCIAVSADSKYAVTGDGSGEVKVWDLAAAKVIATAKTEGIVLGSAFAPDGKTFATASGPVVIWDTATGKKLHTLETKKWFLGARGVAFSPDGKTLFACGTAPDDKEPTVRSWELESRKEGQAILFPGGALGLEFLPDGKNLLLYQRLEKPRTPQIHQLDLTSEKAKLLWKDIDRPGTDERKSLVALAPDGKTVAYCFTPTSYLAPSEVIIADLTTGKAQGAPIKIDYMISGLAYTADGKTLLIGGGMGGPKPGILALWDVASRKERSANRTAHERMIGRLALSPDGKTLITGAPLAKKAGSEIKFWDLGGQ